MALTNEAKQEVLRFLHAGQQLDAIQYLCNTFQLSLLESKMLVDAVQHELDKTASTNRLSASAVGLQGDVRLKVQQRLRQNKKIDAVKYVKDYEKVSLKQAHALVEKIEQEIGLSRTRSHGGSGTPYLHLPKIFCAAGFVLLIAGFAIYYFKQKTINNSERISGSVIALQESRNAYAPVVQYVWQGNEMSYRDNIFSRPAAYDVGEAVQLLVNRKDPSQILIDSFSGRWLLVCIVSGLGGFFVLFGFLFGFLTRKF